MAVLLFCVAVMACAPVAHAEDGYDCEGRRTVAATALPASDSLQLKIVGDGADYSFGFDATRAGNG